jgi:hypothetical protein
MKILEQGSVVRDKAFEQFLTTVMSTHDESYEQILMYWNLRSRGQNPDEDPNEYGRCTVFAQHSTAAARLSRARPTTGSI